MALLLLQKYVINNSPCKPKKYKNALTYWTKLKTFCVNTKFKADMYENKGFDQNYCSMCKNFLIFDILKTNKNFLYLSW